MTTNLAIRHEQTSQLSLQYEHDQAQAAGDEHRDDKLWTVHRVFFKRCTPPTPGQDGGHDTPATLRHPHGSYPTTTVSWIAFDEVAHHRRSTSVFR